MLEAHNPDVQFDWARLLKESMTAEAPRRERDGREGRDGRDRDRRERRDVRQPRPRPMETSAAAAPPMPTPEAAEELQELADAAEVRAAEHADEVFAAESTHGSAAGTDDAHLEADATGPAGERLGAEGVRRLRSRYLDLKARMGEKEDLDESARAELGDALERLNPDAWHTPDEVSAALEQYESTFERLRSIVGRHPRRRV